MSASQILLYKCTVGATQVSRMEFDMKVTISCAVGRDIVVNLPRVSADVCCTITGVNENGYMYRINSRNVSLLHQSEAPNALIDVKDVQFDLTEKVGLLPFRGQLQDLSTETMDLRCMVGASLPKEPPGAPLSIIGGTYMVTGIEGDIVTTMGRHENPNGMCVAEYKSDLNLPMPELNFTYTGISFMHMHGVAFTVRTESSLLVKAC